MLLIRIIDSKLSAEDRPAPDLDALRRMIGGRIETAFLLPNLCGEGDIIGYGDADAIGLRPNIWLGEELIGGPLVVMGVGPHGEHRGLTQQELRCLALEPIEGSPVPQLVVREGDGSGEPPAE